MSSISTKFYQRRQGTAERMIGKRGMRALLRRDSGDRACTILITDFLPPGANALVEPIDRIILMSALSPDGGNLDPPPDQEQDRLVTLLPESDTENEILRLTRKPAPLAPAGIVVYWELYAQAV